MAEIVLAVFLGGIVMQQLQQSARGKNVVSHGSEHACRIAGHGGRVGVLFMETKDASVFGGLDHPEFAGHFAGSGDGGHGDLGVLGHVILDHVGHVHAVDVVAAEYRHHLRIGLFHQVDVLVDGVGGALVPGLVGERICAGTGMTN